MSPKNLAERLDEKEDRVQGWTPTLDDPKLVGEVTDRSARDAGHGSYTILHIRRDDGVTLALHGFGRVLADEVAEQNPQIGDRIGVKFLGDVTKPDGGRYMSFKVIVDHKDTDTADTSTSAGGEDDSVTKRLPSTFGRPERKTVERRRSGCRAGRIVGRSGARDAGCSVGAAAGRAGGCA